MRALVVLLALARVAIADEAPIVKPPDGWRETPELAKQLSEKVNQLSHFGGAKALATVRVYVPPGDIKGPQGQPLVVLIVGAVAGEVTANRDAAARMAIDELRRATQRAIQNDGGPSAAEDRWQAEDAEQKKQLEAWLTWHDETTHTKSVSHLVIAATADRMVAVTGECIEATDVAVPKSEAGKPAQLAAACRQALDTLDPGLPPAQRVKLELAEEGTVTPPSATGTSGAPRLPAMNDGTRQPLPPLTLSQPKPTRDLRPVYVGLGLVVLAALFWWNRRRRAQLEGKTK